MLSLSNFGLKITKQAVYKRKEWLSQVFLQRFACKIWQALVVPWSGPGLHLNLTTTHSLDEHHLQSTPYYSEILFTLRFSDLSTEYRPSHIPSLYPLFPGSVLPDAKSFSCRLYRGHRRASVLQLHYGFCGTTSIICKLLGYSVLVILSPRGLAVTSVFFF
jgi:hypothetical protein